MSPHFLRAQLLMRQERYEQATEELQKALGEEPDNGFFHAMMANALLRRDRWQDALNSAKTAISKEPDSAFAHWTMALVWLERNGLKEAEAALHSAIELDPNDADHHGLLARIHVERHDFDEAIATAERGLALDLENDLCLTFRSRALMALGRKQEATRDADALLANDPDDAWNHCLRGDQLLAEREPAKAREHYVEALRIDPRNAAARYGLALSLKARSPLYGLFLTALLKLNRFGGGAIWIVVVLVFVGLRIGDAWALRNPDWLVAYEAAKLVFWGAVVLFAIANPLFDLLLRFNRETRHVLTDDEIKATNWHLVCFGFAALCALWASFTKSGVLPRTLGMTSLFLTRAVSEVFEATPGYVRRRMAGLTITAAVGLVLTPFILIAGIYWIVSTKQTKLAPAFIRAVLWIPLAVLIFTACADNIRGYFEKRRPDGN